MKKFLIWILTIVLILNIVACGNSTVDSNDVNVGNETISTETHTDVSNDDSSDIKPTTGNSVESDNEPTIAPTEDFDNKINGVITSASVFSEGLALVNLDNNKEKTYCINKEGNIIFELDKKLTELGGNAYNKFINGFALVDGALCDTTGKITEPEDVGATYFSDLALEGGYILAEKVTSDYSSAKKELGVMNTSFEWVVQPSESIYEATGGLQMIPTLSDSYYYNDTFYFSESDCLLDLKTGKFIESVDADIPPEKWYAGDNGYYDRNDNTMLDLSKYENISLTSGCNFVDGKAPVRFYNQEVGSYFFTVINETGDFLFEPVCIESMPNAERFYFDGEYVLVVDFMLGADKIKCYDVRGNFKGELNMKSLGKNRSYSCEIGDGIISVYSGYSFSYECYYYNPDLTPLF